MFEYWQKYSPFTWYAWRLLVGMIFLCVLWRSVTWQWIGDYLIAGVRCGRLNFVFEHISSSNWHFNGPKIKIVLKGLWNCPNFLQFIEFFFGVRWYLVSNWEEFWAHKRIRCLKSQRLYEYWCGSIYEIHITTTGRICAQQLIRPLFRAIFFAAINFVNTIKQFSRLNWMFVQF